jgi:hypothetical protein
MVIIAESFFKSNVFEVGVWLCRSLDFDVLMALVLLFVVNLVNQPMTIWFYCIFYTRVLSLYICLYSNFDIHISYTKTL